MGLTRRVASRCSSAHTHAACNGARQAARGAERRGQRLGCGADLDDEAAAAACKGPRGVVEQRYIQRRDQEDMSCYLLVTSWAGLGRVLDVLPNLAQLEYKLRPASTHFHLQLGVIRY
jgi:hypothetical protein